MSQKSKTSLKTAKIWQRHTLAHACFLVAAGISTSALAAPGVDYTPGAAFTVTNATLDPLAQSMGTYWSTGYNMQSRNYQLGASQINGLLPSNIYTSSLTGLGSTPVNIANNSLLAYAYGNQNASSGLSLANLAKVSNANDGQLALNLQIFSGLALTGDGNYFGTKSLLASATDTGPYISQAGKGSAALTLSGNTVGATLAINTADTSISGATPFAYASSTKGSSAVTYGDNNNSGTPVSGIDAPSSTRGTTGSVNLSNLQTTFNAVGTAQVDTGTAKITVSGTDGGVLSNNINLNDNTIAASNTSNAGVNIVQATSSSSAFSGSVSVTNIQSTKIDSVTATQLANVATGNVQADLRNLDGETLLTGTLNLSGNTVSSKVLGNTAGARTNLGTIAAGNAILFDGNADITGSTAALALGTTGASHQSNITSSSAQGNADLLINSVQRNAGNAFTATIDPSVMSSKVDVLDGGSINQTGNTQAATATANLAGNLISAGPSASIGNIVANAAIVNTQANAAVGVTASVKTSSQTATVGTLGSTTTINGTVNVNDNRITATAEGNVEASTLSLKASNLTVGGNGGSAVALVPSAVGANEVALSGLAASVLSSQKNDGLALTSNNEGNSVSANFNTQSGATPNLAIDASQVSVNGNNLLSSATGNSAGNGVTLSATNATGLNAGLGNSQYITNGSTITSNAGFESALSVGITAAAVSDSALSLNNNIQSASAKGNNASNTMSVTATNASGLAVVANGMFNASHPVSEASDANGPAGVNANADFALANAQADSGSVIKGVLVGSSKITTGDISAASTLSANGNSLTASGSVNSGSNATNLNIGNMTGMVAGLSSAQSAANSVASGSTKGEVSLNTGDISGSSSLTLNGNIVSASASANTVTNSLALTGATASGRDINTVAMDETWVNTASATVASGKASAVADFALSNNQKITAASSTFAAGTESGIKAVTGDITNASLSVNGNSTLASTSGNNASNNINLAVTTLTKPNTGLSSLQTMDTASFTASVNDTSTLVGTGVLAGAADNAQVAVNNNTVKASALGNVATNSIALTGTNATGSDIPFNAPAVSSNVGGNAITTPASVALASLQTSNGNDMNASLGNSGTLPKIVLSTGAVSNGSNLSASGNNMATQVYNNSANNNVALNVTNLNSMTVGLASGQSVIAVNTEGYTPLTASTAGTVQIGSGSVSGGSSLTASNNALTSLVVGNSAGNTLSVTATNASGQNVAGGGSAANAYNRSSSADFALVSEQTINQSVLNTTTQGDVQINTGTVAASALTLKDNSLTAYAVANNASNALSLATTNLTAARAGLANMQWLNNSAQASATIQDSGVSVGAGNLDAAQISVTGNQLKATALGNEANNQFSLSGTNVTAGSVNLDGSYSQASSYVDAGLALASQQDSNSGQARAINGTSLNPTSIVMSGGTVSNASNLAVSNNTVSSAAYTNNVTNGMNLSVTNLNRMTAGLASGQYAEAWSEKTTAETIGAVKADMGDISGASNVALSSNAITASSNVNYAGNTLQVTAQQITGRDAINPGVYSNTSAAVNADLAVANRQYISGDGAFARASVTGNMDAVGGNLTASSLSVNSNSVTANVNGNNAINAMVVSATDLTKASVGLASAQYTEYVAFKSDATSGITVSLNTINDSKLSSNNNQVKAAAVGNAASNTLNLLVSNATGANVELGGFAQAGGGGNIAQTYADLGMTNSQIQDGSTVEAKTGIVGGTPAKVGQYLSDISNGSVVTVNGNALTASAYANSANNAAVVRASSLDNISMATASMQSVSNTDVTAKTNGLVSSEVLAITNSNVTVNSNQIASSAMTNFATNTLDVSASSMAGRSQSPSVDVLNRIVNADVALANTQVMDFGSPVTARTNGSVQLFTDGEAVNNSNLSMNSNAVSAYASGNQAANTLTVAVTHLNATTAGLMSVQSLASSSMVDAMTTGNVLLSPGEIIQSNVTLNDNQVKATALGNLANNQLTLTGTSAQSNSTLSSPAVNTYNTSADVAVANYQYANGSAVSATTRSNDVSDTSRYQLQMSVAGVNTGASVTVDNNAIGSLAYVNSAANSLALGVTTLGNLNAAVMNLQGAESAANASAVTRGQISLDVGNAVDTASLAVNNNAISGAAYSNSSSSTLTVTGTEVTGRAVANRLVQADASAGTLLKTDYAVANSQYSDTSSDANTQGGVAMTIGSSAVSNSNLSLNGNSISAYASSNAATSQLDMKVTRLSQTSAGVASRQWGDTAANVTATVDGSVNMTAGALSSGTVSANDNVIKSTALGNVASNALSLTGSAVSSTGTGNIESSAASVGVATVSADVGLGNSQTQSGVVTASTTGTVNIVAGTVSDSSLTLTGNSIKSVAQANSASNDLTLKVTQQNGISAGLSSRQDNDGAVVATTSPAGGAFSISTAGLTNASVTVSGNTVSAVAGKNEAFNTLTVSGANLLGRGETAVTGSVAGTSSVTGAAFAVMNEQAATSSVAATVDAGASGLSTSGAFNGGTVTISGNTVLASANANTAGNTLTLAATNTLEASGVVNNVQTLADNASVSASVARTSALSVETGTGAGSATVAVTGNQVKATAVANMASNVLNASASNGIATAGAVTSPVDTTATPTFAVLNSQHTGSGSSVSSVINGFNMGGAQLNGALNGGSASVAGNVVQSVAYGNSATNAIQVSALPAGLNTASASITNVQYNLASVTSTVQNMNVQGNGVNTSGSAGVNISGNSIVAMAVGNRSVNSITGR